MEKMKKVAALLLLFICMAFYTMIDIGAVIFLLDQSYQGKKTDLVQTARYAGQLCLHQHFILWA